MRTKKTFLWTQTYYSCQNECILNICLDMYLCIHKNNPFSCSIFHKTIFLKHRIYFSINYISEIYFFILIFLVSLKYGFYIRKKNISKIFHRRLNNKNNTSHDVQHFKPSKHKTVCYVSTYMINHSMYSITTQHKTFKIL